MDASQYKDYVLVLLFVKYVSDKYAGVSLAPITIPPGAGFKDMVELKGKSDIGDQINTTILAPLANANKLSDMPDFNDATKLGSGKEMVDRLTNLIAIFENPALDFPATDAFERFKHYGVPPAKQGDYAYLLHILRSLKSAGKGACILPHGVLSRRNAEAVMRKNLVQRGYIKAVIGLPPNLFYGTGIPPASSCSTRNTPPPRTPMPTRMMRMTPPPRTPPSVETQYIASLRR